MLRNVTTLKVGRSKEKLDFLALSLNDFKLIYLFDIIIVAFVFYKLILLIRGTRAVHLIKGIMILVIATFITEWLDLNMINWVLTQAQTMLIVALPIVFQPELRRALERLGRGNFLFRPMVLLREEDLNRLINEFIKGFQVLTKSKTGALVIIEREIGLKEYIEEGVKVDAVVSAELLINLFIPKSPLHDGAVIIRGDRILSASSFLPLSSSSQINNLGSKHRAGLGVTERSDALALIVSEEKGFISVAKEGKLIRYLDEESLKELLEKELQPRVYKPFWQWK